jgi:hypothetical protein
MLIFWQIDFLREVNIEIIASSASRVIDTLAITMNLKDAGNRNLRTRGKEKP